MKLNRIARPLAQLLLPIVLVAIAATVRTALLPVLHETPYVIFFPAIIVSAMYGGLWFGLFATVLSATAASISFGPSGLVQFDIPGHFVGISAFLASNIIVIGIIIRLRRTQQRITTEAQRLRQSEEELKTENTERKRAEEELRKAKDVVEMRVQERTAELGKTMRELEEEIAERMHAEDAVKAERQRLNDVLEMLPAYVVLLTPDYHVPFANRIFRERFGESHGRRCYEYLFNRSEPCDICETYTVLKTMAPHHWEWTGPDGRNYDIFDFPFTDSDGSTFILEMGIDITERKKAEEKIKLASAYNRSLIEASFDPLVTINADGKITDVNTATEKVTGCSREELIGTDFSNYFTESEKARAGYQQVFREGLVQDYALEIRHRNGHVTPVLYNASVYRNEAGDVIGVFAAARDITVQKEAETLIVVNNELLKLFSQTFSRKEYLDAAVALIREWTGCRCIGIRMLDRQGNIPYESYTGFSREFWEMENFLSVSHDLCICTKVISEKPDSQERPFMTQNKSFYSNDTLAFLSGLTEEEKKRYRATCIKKGFRSLSVIPIRYNEKIIGAVHIADEREGMVPLKVVESIESITPLIGEAVYRFDIEDEVRQSKTLLEQVFSNIHVLIAYMDKEFNFIRVNRLYAEADGRKPEFFVGKNHFDLYPNEENEAIFREVVRTGNPYFTYAKSFVYAANPERGVTYWDWSLLPVKDSAGNVTGLVMSLINVTEKILLQTEAVQTAHLASLGELAAGVAHEINNPLNGIINYAQILSNKISAMSKEHDIANRIIKEGGRIANIVRSLLSFARKRTEEKSISDISAILSDTLLLTEAQMLKDSIKLKVNMPEDLPDVIANSQQIQQVFLNLINNARYALNQKYPAMDGNKVLEISGDAVIIDGKTHVRITFNDMGVGIPANMLDKVVNPFFSTKPSGKGTGLGLSISHGIIRDHDGRMKIESVEGEFTRIIIDLPAAEGNS